MRPGLIVKAIDGSYSQVIVGNVMKETGNICAGQQYIVLVTDCILPTKYVDEKNDTIMRDIDSGEILFSQKRFLLPIHKCNVCPKCGCNIQ